MKVGGMSNSALAGSEHQSRAMRTAFGVLGHTTFFAPSKISTPGPWVPHKPSSDPVFSIFSNRGLTPIFHDFPFSRFSVF